MKSPGLPQHQNKRPHNITNSLYLDPNELEQKVVERFKRYEIIKEKEPMAEEYLVEDAEIVLSASALLPVS